MRLLIVEDEPMFGRQMQRRLNRETYAVDLAACCRTARDLAIEAEYDLIVLSLTLPDGCGLDLIRLWRGEGLPTPILILSNRDHLHDKVAGLDAGADDYLTRPFAWEELCARARSLLRRRHCEPVDTLSYADLTLDRTHRQVLRNGRPIPMTVKEFAILEQLMLHPGRVVSRTVIAEHAWDGSYEARSNTIDVLIARIRRKLEDGGRDRLIATVKGLGYALRIPLRSAC